MTEPWQQLRRVDNNPKFAKNAQLDAVKKKMGLPDHDEVWINDRYQVVVRYMRTNDPDMPEGRDGMVHLSIHQHTRDPVRNWRHLQAIKNEVAGPDRWAVEIFPPEEFLVDTSNEYHLEVMPKDSDIPFGFHDRLVTSDEQAEAFNKAGHKGRQEPWDPGIPTGGDRDKDDPKLPDPELLPDDPPEKVTPARASKVKGLVGR